RRRVPRRAQIRAYGTNGQTVWIADRKSRRARPAPSAAGDPAARDGLAPAHSLAPRSSRSASSLGCAGLPRRRDPPSLVAAGQAEEGCHPVAAAAGRHTTKRLSTCLRTPKRRQTEELERVAPPRLRTKRQTMQCRGAIAGMQGSFTFGSVSVEGLPALWISCAISGRNSRSCLRPCVSLNSRLARRLKPRPPHHEGHRTRATGRGPR